MQLLFILVATDSHGYLSSRFLTAQNKSSVYLEQRSSCICYKNLQITNAALGIINS